MLQNSFYKALLIFFLSLFGLGGIYFYQQSRLNDGKLHVVFCDVGQGDSILIRTPKGMDIVIDGGPNDAMLNCLGRFLPFWDRKIELVLLSHPHADHFTGFLSLFKHYAIGSFASENLSNTTEGFKQLEKDLASFGKNKQYLLAGAFFKTKDGVRLSVLGPTRDFLTQTSPNGTIGESKEFASLILLLHYGEHSFLFTGDSQDVGLIEASERLAKPVTVLQLPHHGSKTGIAKETLFRLSPKLGVISVGKNNYGHPTKEILEILKKEDIKILRTDQNGNIELISDGKSLSIGPSRQRF